MADRDLRKRLTDFGIEVTLFARTLPEGVVGDKAKRQLVRSATSIGADYREAQFGRTKAEFTSKIQIALQEAYECQHWLETLMGTLPAFTARARELLSEAREITAILTASVRTAMSRPTLRGRKPPANFRRTSGVLLFHFPFSTFPSKK